MVPAGDRAKCLWHSSAAQNFTTAVQAAVADRECATPSTRLIRMLSPSRVASTGLPSSNSLRAALGTSGCESPAWPRRTAASLSPCRAPPGLPGARPSFVASFAQASAMSRGGTAPSWQAVQDRIAGSANRGKPSCPPGWRSERRYQNATSSPRGGRPAASTCTRSPGARAARLSRQARSPASPASDVVELQCEGHRVLRRREDIAAPRATPTTLTGRLAKPPHSLQEGRHVLALRGDHGARRSEPAVLDRRLRRLRLRIWRLPRRSLDRYLASPGRLPMIHLPRARPSAPWCRARSARSTATPNASTRGSRSRWPTTSCAWSPSPRASPRR